MPSSMKRSHSITNGARVLVVDDDSDGAEAAGKLLETFGCNVSLVVSAGEALERIEEGADIDLVFSDVVMPDIDGLEFAERLNAVAARIAGDLLHGLHERRRGADRLRRHGADETVLGRRAGARHRRTAAARAREARVVRRG